MDFWSWTWSKLMVFYGSLVFWVDDQWWGICRIWWSLQEAIMLKTNRTITTREETNSWQQQHQQLLSKLSHGKSENIKMADTGWKASDICQPAAGVLDPVLKLWIWQRLRMTVLYLASLPSYLLLLFSCGGGKSSLVTSVVVFNPVCIQTRVVVLK